MDRSELRELIAKLEARNDKRKAATAIVAGTGVLAAFLLVGTLYMHKPQAPVAQAPTPIASTAPDALAGATVEGKAAIVYDLATGQVLYAKNAESQLPLASLTKLLTMYAAARTLSPSSPVAIGAISINDAGDSGFTTGEVFTFHDLARLALVASSNVAAESIAQTAQSRRDSSTANLLAGAAAAAGLSQTYAVNGSGLDESLTESGGYGSAKDVAVLAGQLLTTAPDIARATTEQSITVTSESGVVHTLPNTNPDAVHIPNLLLSKTGFTDLAGGNLAVVFDAGMGHPVAIVVLGSSKAGRFYDVDHLLSLTLDHFAGIDAGAKAASSSL